MTEPVNHEAVEEMIHAIREMADTCSHLAKERDEAITNAAENWALVQLIEKRALKAEGLVKSAKRFVQDAVYKYDAQGFAQDQIDATNWLKEANND